MLNMELIFIKTILHGFEFIALFSGRIAQEFRYPARILPIHDLSRYNIIFSLKTLLLTLRFQLAVFVSLLSISSLNIFKIFNQIKDLE